MDRATKIAWLEEQLYREQLKARTNESFYPLYYNQSRYLVIMGGAGSGKSIFAGQKILERVTREPHHRILVLRKVYRTIKQSCFSQLKRQALEYYPDFRWKFTESPFEIENKTTGSTIIFEGLDDVAKKRSIADIDTIWVEEASDITEDDFTQLDFRIRGITPYYKQIIFTFNPINITHWLKKVFFDQIHPDATTSRTTYLTNAFIDDKYKDILESRKETNPYYYQVYCLGNWGVIGKGVFSGEIVSNRIETLQKNPTECITCDMTADKRLIETREGSWHIYKQPEPRHFYICGADVAEGTARGDYSTIQVIDAKTYEQVAVYREHVDVDVFAHELEKAGYYYNTALLVPEKNFNPGVIRDLERRCYPKIYLRQAERIGHEAQKEFGWVTTRLSKQAIISDLVEYIRDYCCLVHDIRTLEELLVYSRDDVGKLGAAEGAHDDLVMALAIALAGALSGQQMQSAARKIDFEKLERLPRDVQDDWYNMSRPQREEMQDKYKLWKWEE